MYVVVIGLKLLAAAPTPTLIVISFDCTQGAVEFAVDF